MPNWDDVSIFRKLNDTKNIGEGWKNGSWLAYGRPLSSRTMYLCLIVIAFCASGCLADFPGLRRPPTNWNANSEQQEQQEEDQNAFLAQIGSMIEHHARMRLLQHLAQISREKAQQAEQSKDAAPFAYSPDDPRYFLPDYSPPAPHPLDNQLYDKVKAPMDVNPKLVTPTSEVPPTAVRHSSVVQKPINMNDSIGIYMVAMIAGVSAACTVAAIAVGVAWYTLKQRIKAAADVEYPAYGVTGPSKDLLYPNEKKFAQSVDMYHYQQQKQKKSSLEKSTGETNDGFSDLDGDFEVEDGDYTVYECPGFAPTGEMEVKNPLFADEPITVAQKHQPSPNEETKKAKDISPEKKRGNRKK